MNRNDLISSSGHLGQPNTIPIERIVSQQKEEDASSSWRLAAIGTSYEDQELVGRDIIIIRAEDQDPSSPIRHRHRHRAVSSFHQVMSTRQSNENGRSHQNNCPPIKTTTTIRASCQKEVDSSSSRSSRQNDWINNLPWIRKSIEFADKARESE